MLLVGGAFAYDITESLFGEVRHNVADPWKLDHYTTDLLAIEIDSSRCDVTPTT